MSLKHLAVVGIIIFCSFSGLHDILQKKTYIYDKQVNNLHTKIVSTIISKKNCIFIKETSPNHKKILITSIDFILKKYKFKDKEMEYEIRRNDDILTISGRSKDMILQKNLKIGKDAWFQDLGFDLIPFLRSTSKKEYFCLISPKDFSLQLMVAEKEKIEKIILEGKEYSAQRVLITLRGFKSRFWHAKIWFDARNNDFLIYEATSGPGTPLNTIKLRSRS